MRIEIDFYIELRHDEVIVSMVQHKGYIVAITNHGTVYKIYPDD